MFFAVVSSLDNSLSFSTRMAAVSASPPVPKLLYKKVKSDAFAPVRMSPDAAGLDLFSCEDVVVPPHDKALISTGLILILPPGTYGRIAPRSGLAAKFFIDVGAGVIDADYRGEVKVLLFNFSQHAFNVRKGDRIAQLVVERIFTPELEEVSSVDDTIRGGNGFGSTGTGSEAMSSQRTLHLWLKPNGTGSSS